MTDQEKNDTLDNIVGRDFYKKERSLWDDQWMIRESDEKPSEQGLAAESD